MTQLTDQSKTSIGPSTLLPSPALHPLDLPSKAITKETNKLTHANASAPSPSHTVSSPPKSSPPLPQIAHANQSYPHPLSPTAPHKFSISIKAPLSKLGKNSRLVTRLEKHIYIYKLRRIYEPPHYSPERYTPTPADYTYPSWPHASCPPPTAHAPPRRRRVRTLGVTKRCMNFFVSM